ncbi:DUF4145 domain-containing protein [Brucella sp. 6810]|uniref:DUF4145 domain-containing protein n=1 Tax=Brucella sp. 6810 TaxID=2769351 RepID=UPI00165B556C|nr:DUF4145 domain-containing protein [Brucella sp. 6810]QNQ63567.1 DUF4145 domain-containing protein [Brucella sp. 6810]
MSNTDKRGLVLRAYCSSCQGERNCEVKGHHIESGNDGEGYYQWYTDWYLLSCRGCDHVFAQTVSTNSEEYYQDYDADGEVVTEYIKTVETWPARSKRNHPDWFKHSYIETDVENTAPLAASLKELYGALDADLMVLASIGIRTSFDIASELLGIDPTITFKEKLDALVTDKFILEAEKDSIETLVEAGSASAHRGWKPSQKDLDALMNSLEDFIYSSMVFPAEKRAKQAKLAETKDNVPKRIPRKKGKKKEESK